MTISVAINGFGRIGTGTLRAIFEYNRNKEINVMAVNNDAGAEFLAHKLKYDSVHGHFPGEVRVEGDSLIINGHKIKVTGERDPSKLPLKSLGIDLVYECTGAFRDKKSASMYLDAGAKKVLISAPGTDVDATIVFGVNDKTLKASDTIVSNASCTTNCLAPVAKVLHEKLGIVKGLMNTVHAYTSDQRLVDARHSDLRRARAAAQSIIPTKTGAAQAVGLVLPELAGKLDGFAMRVPTANVSIVDFTFEATRETTIEEVNGYLEVAAQGELQGILKFSTLPLVSIDFNHDPASSIVDAELTKVKGNLVKVCAWYDNEWGFSNRMIDTSLAMMSAK